MKVTATLGIIISGFALFVAIITAIFVGMQTSSMKEQTKYIREQTITAREAAKVAKKALCQTLETGLDVTDLTRLTLLGGFSSPLTPSQQNEFAERLKIQKALFERFAEENDCPKRIGK